jgi:biopolymer transport protein TolR
MAASVRKRGGGGRYRPMAEINVTPLVDVMLVLLIIFMVTAPLLTTGVNLDLPRTQAAQISNPDEPLTISIRGDGQVFIQETETSVEELVPRLQAIAQNKPELRIFVRGDRATNYGRMAEVLAAMIQGGFTKVALLTDPTPAASPAPAATPARPANPPARPQAPRPAPRQG